ncbi:MAG: sensor histidine kinase [Saprospiraceae bacterium]
MTASLALLAGFLVLFLKKTWDDEKSALAKEVGYVFISAVRKIEEGLLSKMVFQRQLPLPPGDAPLRMLKMAMDEEDSARVVAIFKNEKSLVQHEWQGPPPSAEKYELKIERNAENLSGIADLKGSISMVIALETSDSADTLGWQRRDFLPQLVASFDSAMAAAGLQVEHQIVRQAAATADKIHTASYTDEASGEQFFAEISNYNFLIFRKILPQIALAALVFGMVALAFFSIWKNLLRQQKLAALRNDLLQNISHELKTPVSTVGVALEALRDFEVMKNPQRTSEYLEIAQNELTRLTLLVDKVLGMAQFEKDALPMRRANFDFQKMLEEVLAAMRLQFEKHRAVVNFEAQSEVFSMLGDRLHLAGVVFNLLDNALKYGGDPPEISIQLAENQENIKLTIADNGPGVPPEFEQKVFEKFFRVPTGAVHDVKGHGLGLSYVAAVIGQHGGSVVVHGSVFTVTLKKGQ